METISAASVLASVIAVVQVLKWSGLPKRFAPIASLAIGLAFAIFFLHDITRTTIFTGLIIGLTASGAWSGVKATFGK